MFKGVSGSFRWVPGDFRGLHRLSWYYRRFTEPFQDASWRIRGFKRDFRGCQSSCRGDAKKVSKMFRSVSLYFMSFQKRFNMLQEPGGFQGGYTAFQGCFKGFKTFQIDNAC